MDGRFGITSWLRDASVPDLSGDRAIEWSWVIAHLPTTGSRVLDLGAVSSPLTGIASRLGHAVVAVDIRDIEYELPGVVFVRADLAAWDPGHSAFDIIMNCSMIEHVGIKDRYGSKAITDGDLIVMRKLKTGLASGGRMLLTIPVGIDAEFAPYHRIYGAARLPELLGQYTVAKEEYWCKNDKNRWLQCERSTALSTHGSERYYALGLFVLE